MSDIKIAAMLGIVAMAVAIYLIIDMVMDKVVLDELKALSAKLDALDKKLDDTYGKTSRDVELIKISVMNLERKTAKEKTADGIGVPNSGTQK